MALAMFKLLSYFLMFSISNGPIATIRLKFLEFFSIFKSPPVLKGQQLHISTFAKSQFWSKIPNRPLGHTDHLDTYKGYVEHVSFMKK